MELKEAKHILEERKSVLINSSMPDTSLITAIDTVLNELDNRIPKRKVDEIIDDYEEQLTEKNNIIFNLQIEREALWNKIDEEFE